MDLKKAIKLAIEKERQTLGPVVDREAGKIDGITIDDEENIKVECEDTEKAFKELTDALEKIGGDVALNLIARDLKKEMDVDKEEVPDKISESL